MENNLSATNKSWLHITDDNHFIEKLDDITCPRTDLDPLGIVNLAELLNLNSFYLAEYSNANYEKPVTSPEQLAIFEEIKNADRNSTQALQESANSISDKQDSKVINKELGGLQIYNPKYGGVSGSTLEERKDNIRRTITITCASWQYSVNIIDDHDYTTEDIAILESENHCLSYFAPILMHTSSNRRSVTKETCNNALLLSSTKQKGISCGYMEIDIQESHNIVETRKTCFLYDPNVKNNKVLDEATRLNLNALSKKATDDSINYSFKIYPANGNGYSYDSKTGSVQDATYEDDGNINRININCIFLIILLFL